MATLTAKLPFFSDLGRLFPASVSMLSRKKLALQSTDNSGLSLELVGTFSDDGQSGRVTKLNWLKDGAIQHTISLSVTLDALRGVLLNAFEQSDFTTLDRFIFAGDDRISGSAGNDFIVMSGGGSDTVKGNAGNDLLISSDLATSKLHGGAGSDFLVASGVRDTLTGGSGMDFFKMLGPATITDLKKTDDLIELTFSPERAEVFLERLIPHPELPFLSFSSTQIRTGKDVTTVVSDTQMIAYDHKTGMLYLDDDGVGGEPAEWLLTLKNKPKLTAEELANDLLTVTIVGSNEFAGLAPLFNEAFLM